MIPFKSFILGCLIASTVPVHAQTLAGPQSVEDYNQSLIDFGVSWKAGKSIYFPSFYTGFAPKIENANRIHFHLGRGNQARLTATLDELSVLSYLYSLRARADFATSAVQQGIIAPVGQPQMDYFNSIVASPRYKIRETINAFESGKITREYFYAASLEIMKLLNPGRVFPLRFDLREQFLNWKSSDLAALAALAQKQGAGDVDTIKSVLTKNSKEAIVAVNRILMGRVNLVLLDARTIAQLATLIHGQNAGTLSDDLAVEQILALFQTATQNRFDFRVVDQSVSRPALECNPSGQCDLVYAELNAIYPVGSVKNYTKDRDGNQIPTIREVGAMNFIERGYHDVDHIREEPYYGWIPKMDYTGSGNGIHNPAVRTSLSRSTYKWLYSEFSIPQTDNTLWVVARGGVSHGCTRMAAGHLLEVRHIFPTSNEEMTKLVYTGNASSDYDLYDIDGDGQLEVMGVDYLIAYALDSDSGAGYREGNGFIDEALKRDPFYYVLYGKKQFENVGGKYVFNDPYMSYFAAGSAKDQRAKAFSVRMPGKYELYEQSYEKDKIQFYDLPTLKISSLASNGNNKTNKSIQLVRLFGRVNACGPFKKEFPACQEDLFKQEANSLFGKVK